jgi:acyl-CoA thioesterase-1
MPAMNPAVRYFISGDSLYGGSALLLMMVAVSPWLRRQWVLRSRNVAAWLAVALMVMACPPFPWIVDTIFLVAFGLWLLAWNRSTPGQIWSGLQRTTTILMLLLVVALPASEFSHRRMPGIMGEPSDHLVVIGDSISSGVDPRVPAWPAVMQQVTGVRVTNLARPGALTIEALEMAGRLTPEDRVVLLEIGGNDLLAGIPSREFERNLEALLARLVAPGRIIVMFELPLLPHKIAYGHAQRRLAEKYGISLVPKRYFVEVLAGADGTSDGLHLSPVGTHRMASLVFEGLSQVLKAQAVRSI